MPRVLGGGDPLHLLLGLDAPLAPVEVASGGAPRGPGRRRWSEMMVGEVGVDEHPAQPLGAADALHQHRPRRPARPPAPAHLLRPVELLGAGAPGPPGPPLRALPSSSRLVQRTVSSPSAVDHHDGVGCQGNRCDRRCWDGGSSLRRGRMGSGRGWSWPQPTTSGSRWRRVRGAPPASPHRVMPRGELGGPPLAQGVWIE